MDLRGYRLSKNMTQLELAHTLGIKRTTISMWETGKSKPKTIDMLRKLADVLALDVKVVLACFYNEPQEVEV